jgi:hypothetical protein
LTDIAQDPLTAPRCPHYDVMRNSDVVRWALMGDDCDGASPFRTEDSFVQLVSHDVAVKVLRDAKTFSNAYGNSMRSVEGGIPFHADWMTQ